MCNGKLPNVQNFVGTWKLISFEYRRRDGALTFPFGEDAEGLLIYTQNGYMSAQVADANRTRFNGSDALHGTPEEIKSAFLSSAAYYGQFEVDTENNIILHHTDISTLPNQSNTVQKRFYSFENDKLILTTPPTEFGGDVITGVLIWKRL